MLMVLLSSSSVFDSSTETYFSPCLGDLVLLGAGLEGSGGADFLDGGGFVSILKR